MKIKLLLLLITLNAFAFENQDDKGIINGLDWAEISTFAKDSPEYQNSLAVKDVYDENGFRCNGTHIGNSLVLTANHCCSKSGNTYGGRSCVVYSRNIRRDICALKCSLPENFPAVKIGTEVTSEVYILQNQCDYVSKPGCALSMKYSPGKILEQDGFSLYYDNDTLGGTSGAGVFNENHELIAVHNSYQPNYRSNRGSLIK